MKNYSEKLIYQNGNRVLNGEGGDHTTVRNLLATGLIKRVVNFGALLAESCTKNFVDVSGMSKVIQGDYELYIKHEKESLGFDLSALSFTEEKNVNTVYYQRISE